MGSQVSALLRLVEAGDELAGNRLGLLALVKSVFVHWHRCFSCCLDHMCLKILFDCLVVLLIVENIKVCCREECRD
jgi:hypothetical protein